MKGDHWGTTVTVVLHHAPEDEDFEGGFEAVTMRGVPGNVAISGSDRDSREAALDHLLGGLRALSFTGRVAVEDATEVGRVDRYEVPASGQAARYFRSGVRQCADPVGSQEFPRSRGDLGTP